MATSLITRHFRSAGEDRDSEPGWLKRQVTSGLQSISRRACVHPIHTIVVIALLASTTYVGLLEGSFFDTVRNPRDLAGQVDVDLVRTPVKVLTRIALFLVPHPPLSLDAQVFGTRSRREVSRA